MIKLRQILRLCSQEENLKREPGDKYKILEAMFPVIEKKLKRSGKTREKQKNLGIIN